MHNCITATIPFDFKGVHYTPSAVIDLDDLITRELDISSIHIIVATHNQIGNMSYEHEVLMSSEIVFSNPEGFAQDYFDGSHFDMERFKNEYHLDMALNTLKAIAQKHLQIDSLDDHPALKSALLEAYQYGKNSF